MSQPGHWKVDCPNPPPRTWTSPPGPEQESFDPALPSLLTAEDWRCPGRQAPILITSMEPRVPLTVAGKPISFLIDTGATYTAMPAQSGKTKVSQVSVVGVDGLISTPWITKPLPCTLQDTPFFRSFLILPTCPTPILGRDLLSKFKASITIPSPPSDLAWLILIHCL